MSRHLPVAGSLAEPLRAVGARFDTPDALIAAVRSLRSAGYHAVDCYTRIPSTGSAEELKAPKSLLSFLVLGGAVSAIVLALTMQLVPSNLIYPLVVQGKPVDLLRASPVRADHRGANPDAWRGGCRDRDDPAGRHARLNHPMLAWDLFAKDTSGDFFLSVSARDPYFTWKK